jgi:hypothetical protein
VKAALRALCAFAVAQCGLNQFHFIPCRFPEKEYLFIPGLYIKNLNAGVILTNFLILSVSEKWRVNIVMNWLVIVTCITDWHYYVEISKAGK